MGTGKRKGEDVRGGVGRRKTKIAPHSTGTELRLFSCSVASRVPVPSPEPKTQNGRRREERWKSDEDRSV